MPTTLPGDGTIAGPETYPGGEDDLSLQQLSPTSVLVAWGSLFPSQNYKSIVLRVYPRGAEGNSEHPQPYIAEEYVVTGSKHIEITNLWAGMEWVFTIVGYGPNKAYSASYTQRLLLDPMQQELELSLDGWKTTKQTNPEGSSTTFRRVIRRTALGITTNRIEKEALFRGNYGHGQRIYRRITGLHRSWTYEARVEIEPIHPSPSAPPAQVTDYFFEIFSVKSVRGVRTSELLKSIPVSFSANPNGGYEAGSAAMSFVAEGPTIEISLRGGNASTPALEVVESIAITALEIREHTLDATNRSANSTDDDGNWQDYSISGAIRAINDMSMDGSVASYLDVTMNSVNCAWWVDEHGALRFTNVSSDMGQPVAYLADDNGPGKIQYLSYEMTRDTHELINDLSVTNHRVGIKVLSTDEWTADDQILTFQDKKSIEKYGVRNATVEWALRDKGDVIEMRAKELLADFSQRKGKQITSVQCNIQSSPLTFLSLHLFDTIWVELDGRIQESKIHRIKREFGPEQGLITLSLIPLRQFMVSETFREFDLYEQANTFAQFNAIPMAPTFKGWNKTRNYHG